MQAIDWRSVKLAPFKKNFYDPSPEVTHRSAADVERFRTSKEITIIQVGFFRTNLSAWVQNLNFRLFCVLWRWIIN